MTAFDMIKRVLLFDCKVFKEINEDKRANLESAAVVYVSWLVGSISTILMSPNYLIIIIFAGLVFWLVFAGVFHVLARIFGGHGDFWGYVRSIGYCHAPLALGIIPVVGWPIGLIWAIACIIVATKQTNNLSTIRSCLVVLIPVILLLIFALIFSVMVGLNAQLILENQTLNQSMQG